MRRTCASCGGNLSYKMAYSQLAMAFERSEKDIAFERSEKDIVQRPVFRTPRKNVGF